MFRALSKKDLVSVVDIQMGFLQKNISDRGILLEISQEAKEFIVNNNYDSTLGARPIRRSIQNLVEDAIAEGLLLGTLTDFSTISIGVENGKLMGDIEYLEEEPIPEEKQKPLFLAMQASMRTILPSSHLRRAVSPCQAATTCPIARWRPSVAISCGRRRVKSSRRGAS